MALVNPHGGGNLRPLLLEGQALKNELARAQSLPKVKLSSRENGDVIMMGIGGFTPLTGFMTHSDWQGVCDGMKMANGLFWPIPVTLSTDDESVKAGSDIALVDGETGEIMGTMTVTEKYGIDKAHECMQVYKTTDMDHPGVKMVMAQGKYNLAGPVKVLSTGDFKEKYGDQFMTPAETRAMFEKLGWKRIAAFRMSTLPRSPLKRWTAYWSTRCWVRSRRAISLLKCAQKPSACWSTTILPRIPLFRPVIRSTCAMPVRAKRCCMRCSARTTVART